MKILTMLDESQTANLYLPDIRAGMNAGVHRINCQGGLGKAGSPVSVDFCVTNIDPNQVNACARRATNDQTYVAAVGDQVGEGNAGSLFAGAGLPDLPTNVEAASEWSASSTTLFATNAGLLAAAGQAVVACQLGYKKTSEMLIQLSAGQQLIGLEGGALKSYGCPPISHSVPVPPTATDVSSYISTASNGANALLLHLTPNQGTQALKARQQLGIQTTVVNEGAVATAEGLRSVGSAADGMVLATFLPPATTGSPGDKEFLSDMAAIHQSAQVDDNSLSAWVAVDAVATAAHGLTTVNRGTLLQGLKGLTSFDADGITPALNFSGEGPDPTYPRLFNMTVSLGKVKNGQIQPVSGKPRFIPIFKGVG